MCSRDLLAKTLGALSEIYAQNPLSKAALEMYYMVLADIPDDELKLAARAWLSESQWFPKPAELRKKALEITRPVFLSSDEAWQMVLKRAETHGVYSPLELPDALAQKAAALVGWMDICHMPLDQLPFLRNRFDRIYNDLINRTEEERRMLPDVREKRNTLPSGIENDSIFSEAEDDHVFDAIRGLGAKLRIGQEDR